MAIVNWNTTGCFDTVNVNGKNVADQVATIRCLEPLFQNVVTAVVTLAGVALFVMLVIGGFNYMFAGGDAKKLEKARSTVFNAVIGLVVIVAAYLIILLIQQFAGLNPGTLTNFHIQITP